MIDLSTTLLNTKVYNNLEQSIKDDKKNIIVDNALSSNISFMAFLLCKKLKKNIIIITASEFLSKEVADDINLVSRENLAVVFKAREMIYNNNIKASSNDYENQRLKVLYELTNLKQDEHKVIVASVEALEQPVILPEKYKNLILNLKIGQRIKINELAERLVKMGFVKSSQIEGVGQFSVRGEIVDVFPPNMDYPIRLDFWDDEIDNIFLFDTLSQRRIAERLENVFISPVKEVLVEDFKKFAEDLIKFKNKISNKKVKDDIERDIKNLQENILPDNLDKYIPFLFKEKCCLLDYIDNPIIILNNEHDLIQADKSVWWHYIQAIKELFENEDSAQDFGKHILAWEEVKEKLNDNIVISMRLFDDFKSQNKNEVRVLHSGQREIAPWNGDWLLLLSDINYYQKHNFKIIIFAGSEAFTENLIKKLREKNLNISSHIEDLEKYCIVVSDGFISSGVEYGYDNLVIITIGKTLIKTHKSRKFRKTSEHVIINNLEDLSLGDYVVHVDHGIGIFDGISKLELDSVVKDYIKIKYAGDDVLYVPVTQLDLVSKYIGNKEDRMFKLNKLSSTDWIKKKQRVKSAVKDIAKDLIKLQSERMQLKGFAFSKDTDWQNQFESQFEYEETNAQLRCIEEIKKDMEDWHPMDRLLCGDVGVGKTEVALRMAFKAVMDSKQVAILTPTTILSWQHYNTIINRLNDFPIKVEILSRFKTPKQQKEVIKKLKSGEIEIVVGTHRLLQKDVEFKDLGLIIIDEEQRFGVVDKEKFKQLKHNVDVLTLSATPIPRTLNMAMSGVKNMSVIDEMPQDRLPVQTYVLEYDENIITTAIVKEINRGGMVFYLHNRVDSIYRTADKITKMVPGARVSVAHGKMSQNQLTEIWQQLLDHEADVLVCTTIIETGIDIPFCNTLIVEDADKMGLAQLHQLRGRIGRSYKKAYAYMTFNKGKILSEVSAKRLNAIKEFTRFGAGFKIALRDLEIRGAGNILGSEQHGHIDAVGYDMYIKLLSEAVAEEKGETPDFLVSEQCTIDIKVNAYLPENYVEDLSNRIELYKKIAMIKTKDDYDDLMDELIDRFGTPPQPVIDLLNVSFSRNLAIKNNIKEISQKNDDIYIHQNDLDMDLAEKLSSKYQDRLVINLNSQPYIKIKINKSENSLTIIKDILSIL